MTSFGCVDRVDRNILAHDCSGFICEAAVFHFNDLCISLIGEDTVIRIVECDHSAIREGECGLRACRTNDRGSGVIYRGSDRLFFRSIEKR
jgi:hypothetical protein